MKKFSHLHVLNIFKIIVIIIVIVMTNSEETNGSLGSVQVIVRHGERTPDKNFQNPTGTLTNAGKRQMYDFGKFLREKYGKILKNSNPRAVSILSSDKERTIASAQLISLGLLLSSPVNNLSRKEDFPVNFPVRSVPEEIDDFIQISRICPSFQKLLDQSITEYVNEFIEKNPEFFTKFARLTGQWEVLNPAVPSTKIDPFVFYQEEAIHNASMGFPLNEVALEAILNPNLIFKPGYEALKVDTREKTRLYMGPLFRKIINVFSDNKENSMRKLVVYSGHDRNLYTFMLTLSIWEGQGLLPPYGAALILELFEMSNGRKYLEFWYKNETGLFLREVPGCGKPCWLSNIVNLFEDIISQNNEIQCIIKNPADLQNKHQ